MAYNWDKKRKRYIVTMRQGRGKPRFWKSVRTLEEAEALDNELRGYKLKSQQVPPSKTRLTEYIENNFLPGYCQVKVRDRTRQGYESIINTHILPALGYMRLTDITTNIIDRFYAALLQTGLSKTTVHHVHTLLRLILDQARKHKYIIVNPAVDATAPGLQRAEIQCFDFDEVERFKEAAKGSRFYVLYQTALNTGMRRSELCGLRFCDISFDLGMIAVRRVVYRIKGKKGLKVDDPKTTKSRRFIPMTDELADILTTHKTLLNMQFKEDLHRPLNEDDYVFVNVNLGPQDPDKVSKDFHEIVEKNNFGSITFHGLRHTFATLARDEGVDIKDISDILGHSTVATTSDIYQKTKVWLQRKSLENFSRKLNQGAKTP